jgi:hypothetical protein
VTTSPAAIAFSAEAWAARAAELRAPVRMLPERRPTSDEIASERAFVDPWRRP